MQDVHLTWGFSQRQRVLLESRGWLLARWLGFAVCCNSQSCAQQRASCEGTERSAGTEVHLHATWFVGGQ